MITKKIFSDLAIIMIGFGIVIGLFFPFFVLVTGTPSSYVMTPLFFILCILAGFIVGLFNIFLARRIVGSKIRQLAKHMIRVEDRLIARSKSYERIDCTSEDCYIHDIQSADEIGESAHAFNALIETLSEAFQMEENVRSFTAILASNLELDKLSDEALNQLIKNMKASAGAILLEHDGELKTISTRGIASPDSLISNKQVWHVLKNKERLIIDYPEGVTLDGLIVTFRPRTLLIDPIVYKDVCLGVVMLATTESFTLEALNAMVLYGQGLSLAFKNAISHDQLQHLAAIDPLTNILNRRFGSSRLAEEYARSVRNNSPLGVLIFDIDHFKVINDTYGHIVGDKILLMLTRAVKNVLREGDIFYRYGGEEFIVLLPGASRKDVLKAAEQIRHTTEDLETHHNDQTLKITVSIGGTSFPEIEASNAEDLIKVADQKLYQAKDAGRNRSIIA
jgi:two-component system, cell cycle response regulator